MKTMLRNLARRWADAHLAEENRKLEAQLSQCREDRTMFRRNLARVVIANKSLGQINTAYQAIRGRVEAERDTALRRVVELEQALVAQSGKGGLDEAWPSVAGVAGPEAEQR